MTLKLSAMPSTPARDVWQVRIDYVNAHGATVNALPVAYGATVNALPVVYIPANNHDHARRIADAINGG